MRLFRLHIRQSSRHMIRLLPVLLVCGCFFSETGNEQAGGGNTSETETITISRSNGEPAMGASAKIMIRDWESAFQNGAYVEDSLVSDSDGRIIPGRWKDSIVNLLIQFRGEGLYKQSYSFSGDTLKLAPTRTLDGIIIADGADSTSKAYTALEGTDIESEIGPDGSYHFSGVPVGEYTSFVKVDGASITRIERTLEVTDSSNMIPAMIVNLDSLLLDDFEDRDPFGRLRPLLGGARWWMELDTVAGGNSTITPGRTRDFNTAITNAGGIHGYYLPMVYNVGAALNVNWAILGLDLGNGDTDFKAPNVFADLSAMDSLTFWARGEGVITVSFNTRKVLVEFRENRQFEAVKTLGPAWERIVIVPQDILPGVNSEAERQGLVWADVSGGVSNIRLQAYSSVSMDIDDLVIHGVHQLFFDK